jgi:hypothetical protein
LSLSSQFECLEANEQDTLRPRDFSVMWVAY